MNVAMCMAFGRPTYKHNRYQNRGLIGMRKLRAVPSLLKPLESFSDYRCSRCWVRCARPCHRCCCRSIHRTQHIELGDLFHPWAGAADIAGEHSLSLSPGSRMRYMRAVQDGSHEGEGRGDGEE